MSITKLNTYCPENVRLVVHGERVQGFAEKNFIQVSPYGVTVTLHAFSESLEGLIDLEHCFVRLTLNSNLENSAGITITHLDIDDEYELESYTYSFSSERIPEVTFKFIRY